MAKVKVTYECGCELEQKFDTRYAREKNELAKLKRNFYMATRKCPDCIKEVRLNWIANATESQLRALIYDTYDNGRFFHNLDNATK